MPIALVGANIVLRADRHNPSIVSKEWVAQKKIFEEEVREFAHLPVVSVLETENFRLTVDQERLQLVAKTPESSSVKALPQILSKYMAELPETPYKAIGFNYTYRADITSEGLKRLFLADDKRLGTIFSEDYAFGAIIKFRFQEFLVTVRMDPTGSNQATADFNFHFESGERETLAKKLFSHDETRAKSEETLGGLFDGKE